MKILVAGGAGFLGSYTCESLLKLDHEVIALDNLYTGNIDNVHHLLHLPGFKFIKHDITIPIDLEVDGIINMACPASPKNYQKDPVQTIKTNVHGSINLLDQAKRNNSRILQASTSEVYGDPKIKPQIETYWGNVNPIGIRSCYDEGKRAAETLFSDYHRQYEVDIRIARIFNTFGPRMAIDDGRVVSNFIVQALRNQEITIYGEGNQTRSFCFVDDLIQGIVKLFFSKNYLGPINLGNPQPITMKELAKEIIELTNSKSNLVYLPLPEDDPVERKPDIDKAIKNLDWQPKIDRRVGLIRTIEYFKKVI
jgi:UDP-glucuronate decarboxylase